MDDATDVSRLLEQLGTLTRMPEVLNAQELHERVRSERAELGAHARGTSVLVRLDIDAQGNVSGVRALARPLFEGFRTAAVLQGTDSTVRHMDADSSEDPAAMRAAERAACVLRFRPAERDGTPVAFTDMSMTIAF